VPRMTPSTTPASRPAPVDRFRQGEAIGVVGDANLAPEPRLEIAADGLSVEADRIRAAQQAGGPRDGARGPDADVPRASSSRSVASTRCAIASSVAR
jgi:hypothetical protein